MSKDCPQCAGDGFNYETCAYCRGNGGQGCRECDWNGDVKIECIDCHGTGLHMPEPEASEEGPENDVEQTQQLTGGPVPSAAFPEAHLLGGATVCSAVGAPNASGDGPHAPSFSLAAELNLKGDKHG